MTTFDKREEGFEKQFAHDEELQVQGDRAAQQAARPVGGGEARARRRRGRRLCQGGRDRRLRGRPATTTCFGKVRKDFDAKGVSQSDHQIRRTMDELMARAVERDQGERLSHDADQPQHAPQRCAGDDCDMTSTSFSLAAQLRAGETVYTGWCGLAAPLRRRDDRARGLCRRHHRHAARPVGHLAGRGRHRGDPAGGARAGRARAARRISPPPAARSISAPRASSRR